VVAGEIRGFQPPRFFPDRAAGDPDEADPAARLRSCLMNSDPDPPVLDAAIGTRPQIHRDWLIAMHAGDFESAWRATDQLEQARRQRKFRIVENGELVWDGTSFASRHVLVRCLHGLGDTLQFIRFIPALAKLARQVTVAVQPDLLPLFPSQPSVEFRNGWTDEPLPGEVEIEIMELAYALRCTRNTLPAVVPYLDTRWIEQNGRIHLPSRTSGLRVGIIWEASAWDPSRSLPAKLLVSLSACGVEWFSLQQHRSSGPWPLPMHDLSAHTTAVLQAAYAMLQMDLIISVDSMPAHLAGALGRPVWLLLKHEADWRWMAEPHRSPWYPTMRLFRQPAPGDWETPIHEVAHALQSLASERIPEAHW
jgi:hypothetical protein